MSDEIAPVFFDEPASSLIGVMYFPSDLEKAQILAALHLSGGPLKKAAQQSLVTPEFVADVAEIASRAVSIADDIRKAKVAGNIVGEITRVLWHLIATDAKYATWDNAIIIAEEHARKNKSLVQIVRSCAQQHRRDFRRVFHFWGARRIAPNKWDSLNNMALSSEIVLEEFRKFDQGRRSTAQNGVWRIEPSGDDMYLPVGEIDTTFIPSRKRPGPKPKIS